MEDLIEGALSLVEMAVELRLKQALMIIALIVLSLLGLYGYGCLEINTKQLDQYNDIVATAQSEHYKATVMKAMWILSDNKITRLELSNLKSLYERELLNAKRINQKKPT